MHRDRDARASWSRCARIVRIVVMMRIQKRRVRTGNGTSCLAQTAVTLELSSKTRKKWNMHKGNVILTKSGKAFDQQPNCASIPPDRYHPPPMPDSATVSPFVVKLTFCIVWGLRKLTRVFSFINTTIARTFHRSDPRCDASWSRCARIVIAMQHDAHRASWVTKIFFWTVHRLGVVSEMEAIGSWNFESCEFYPTFSVNPRWIRLWIWLVFVRCVSGSSSFPTRKTAQTQKLFWKTKSRTLQLHFGTNPSIILPMVFENGTFEVEVHDFAVFMCWQFDVHSNLSTS